MRLENETNDDYIKRVMEFSGRSSLIGNDNLKLLIEFLKDIAEDKGLAKQTVDFANENAEGWKLVNVGARAFISFMSDLKNGK